MKDQADCDADERELIADSLYRDHEIKAGRLPSAGDLAKALSNADWSGASIGNKEMLKSAILHLKWLEWMHPLNETSEKI